MFSFILEKVVTGSNLFSVVIIVKLMGEVLSIDNIKDSLGFRDGANEQKA